MTNEEVEKLVGYLEVVIDRLRAQQRAPALKRSPPIEPRKAHQRPRYVIAATAFRDRGYKFDDQKVRRICKRNSFAVLLGGTWYVREPEFSEFADRVERGEARF